MTVTLLSTPTRTVIKNCCAPGLIDRASGLNYLDTSARLSYVFFCLQVVLLPDTRWPVNRTVTGPGGGASHLPLANLAIRCDGVDAESSQLQFTSVFSETCGKIIFIFLCHFPEGRSLVVQEKYLPWHTCYWKRPEYLPQFLEKTNPRFL